RQTRNGDPLQRRPSVRRVPLLPSVERRRDDPAGLQQFSLGGSRDRSRLRLARDSGKQRIKGRGADAVDALFERPAIVEINAARLMPEIAIDCGASGGGAPGVIFSAIMIACPFATGADRILQAEQQSVEVDRNDFGRVDRDKRSRISEPARAEIPPALGAGANLPVGLM